MQLYAFDSYGQLISAHQAFKQIDYQCFECQKVVRLRAGSQRQRHFYHLEPTPFCRQHQKGAIHIQLQSYFFEKIPLGDCQLEYSFPSIRRIADVVWFSQKIVFEIQCSPITSEEVLSRNHDYEQLGWKVVWILHDQRYNKIRLSSAEKALRYSPHFFTNMDCTGQGIIYDQFDLCDKGIRLKILGSLPINIEEVKQMSHFKNETFPLMILQKRMKNWNLSFSGDLIHSFLNYSYSDYFCQAEEIEKLLNQSSEYKKDFYLFHTIWKRGIVIPYQIFFRFILERMCR